MSNPGEPDFSDVSDVTRSGAYLILDALQEQQKIVADRANYLKEKHKQLHDRVLTIYNNDNFLLRRAKMIRKDLDKEKTEVEKCGEIAKEDDATIHRLKRELAQAENEVAVAQERESMLQVENIELDRKKTSLQNEVDDAVAEEENRMRPAIEALTKSITELKEEIESTSDKFEKLKNEREDAVKKEISLKETMDKQDIEIYERKLELTKLDREPERAKKQADIVEKATQTAQKELNALLDKLNIQHGTIENNEERRKNMEEQRYELALTLETQRTAIEQREKMMETIERNLESERESNSKLVHMSTQFEMNLKGLSLALSKEKDTLNKTIKEKETGLKNYRRIDQMKREIMSEKETLSKQKEILHRELNRYKQVRKKLKDDLEDLKRDVDILIDNFLKEETDEKMQSEDLLALLKQIKHLEAAVAQKAEDEQGNNRKISDLSVHRENKSREASKNKAKVALAKDDLKVKEVIIKELQKRNNEQLQRLQQLTEMYSVVKRERSNKAAMIQSASQAMSETQEKIKILDNELEVLRRESQSKDKTLVKVRRDLHDEQTYCENLRVEFNKLYNTYRQKKRHIQEQCSQINKLNTVINATEEEMLQLKKKYEEAVENRNFTGIQLIDRNDELCILYEKANIQENILKNGQIELKNREEETRAMAIKLSDLQREIDNCQKQLPKVKEAEAELFAIREQLDDEKWRADTLEEDLVDPKNASRWRKLQPTLKGPGADEAESAETLQLKEQELEQKLYHQHEKLMEKELVLAEVTELSDRLRKQAIGGRDNTLALAKKVNSLQSNLKQKTKKMMAVLSELSMVEANSIKIQTDIQDVQITLEEAEERLASGIAPSDEIEQEFYARDRERARQQEMMLKSQMARDQERNMPPQVTRTTAEQRPNAYIPNAELMIPKPYGAHAPVKAIQTPNVVRFFHAPVKRDIEI